MSSPRSPWRTVSADEETVALAPSPEGDVRLTLLEDVERSIVRARQLGLKDSVFLLEVVRLDLKAKIHNISDEELHALSTAAHATYR